MNNQQINTNQKIKKQQINKKMTKTQTNRNKKQKINYKINEK